MNTDSLTVNLPVNEIEFIKKYAERHKVTISELIDRYVKHLQFLQKSEIHPDLARISGILPDKLDVMDAYCQHVMEKHS
uniref:DUF6364 family protein n=1 Tax=Candidatus Electronema sp. TaxID=2698783 RepID=UPI004055CA3B